MNQATTGMPLAACCGLAHVQDKVMPRLVAHVGVAASPLLLFCRFQVPYGQRVSSPHDLEYVAVPVGLLAWGTV